MPQNPLVPPAGHSVAFNVAAPAVIKAAPGRCVRLIVLAAGTAGSWTVNDCATTGAAATANELFTVIGTTAAGTIFDIDAPLAAGLTVSAVGTGGVAVVVYS